MIPAENHRDKVPRTNEILNKFMTEDMARMHLRDLKDLVREVRPDVWAAVESGGLK